MVINFKIFEVEFLPDFLKINNLSDFVKVQRYTIKNLNLRLRNLNFYGFGGDESVFHRLSVL